MTEFLDRREKKMWSENDDRNDVQFWKDQKEEYLEDNPSHASMFIEQEDDGDNDGNGEGNDEVVDVTDDNYCVSVKKYIW